MIKKQNSGKPAKLSIITINRNNAEGLDITIKSVIEQTYSDYEFIVIDGASSDASVEVINKFNNEISYWVSEPDSGVYNAMNKGIQIATGDYCFFLNSGDYLADSRVFENVFEKNPSEDVLFGNLHVIINGKVVGEAFGKENLSFSDVYAHTIKHQTAFIKRRLFEKYGLYNENRKIVADWEFFIKTLGLGDVTYRFIDYFISYFDNDGISNNNEELILKEKEEVIIENIPKMMHPDYEFLLKFKRYEGVYKYKVSFFLVKVLNKFFKF